MASSTGREDEPVEVDADGIWQHRPDDWDDEQARPPPVEVPHTELSPEALQGVVESFVLREGTDYGERDVPHEAKVAQVLRQLERGEARILFDPYDSSVTISLVPPADRHKGRPGVD